MLLNVSYDYETKMIGVPCPKCCADVEYDVPAIIDAINLGNWLECSDCKCVFGIDLGLLDTRSPTLRADGTPAIELLRYARDRVSFTDDPVLSKWCDDVDAVLKTAGVR